MEGKINIFIIQLAVIFLPGLIWERVSTKYGPATKPKQFEVLMRTFTFGLTAYMVTFAIYRAFGVPFLVPSMQGDELALDANFLWEYVCTILVSIICSVIWLYLVNFGALGRILGFIKATKRFSPLDIWDQVLSSRRAFAEYIYVRDYEKKKVFGGWVEGFSESETVRELFLRNVRVYDLSGKRLYDMPRLYLGRSPQNIDIEFPVDGGPFHAITSARPTPSKKRKKSRKGKPK